MSSPLFSKKIGPLELPTVHRWQPTTSVSAPGPGAATPRRTWTSRRPGELGAAGAQQGKTWGKHTPVFHGTKHGGFLSWGFFRKKSMGKGMIDK